MGERCTNEFCEHDGHDSGGAGRRRPDSGFGVLPPIITADRVTIRRSLPGVGTFLSIDLEPREIAAIRAPTPSRGDETTPGVGRGGEEVRSERP